MTIAHHKAMDHHRAARRRPVPAAELPDVPHHDALPEGEDPIWLRVRALPPKQRAAVTLRSVAGLSHAEVARVLGCTEEAARRSAHEGLKRLREELPA
jgi:RNA polymerase sigma factor (sigma-70 family)